MVEAGEVGHWAVLGKLNETAGEEKISGLVEWTLPISRTAFLPSRTAPFSSREKGSQRRVLSSSNDWRG
jgi:hypothetical protein